MDPIRTTVLMFKASSSFRKCSGGLNHYHACGAPCHYAQRTRSEAGSAKMPFPSTKLGFKHSTVLPVTDIFLGALDLKGRHTRHANSPICTQCSQ